jgi:uncharacterized membrane protein
MNHWRHWREAAAEEAALREWARQGVLDSAAIAAARRTLGPTPAPVLWRWYLDRLALWLGIVLCAAGAICFIAANWEHIGKFARLYGMQALVIATVAVAARLGLGRLGGQAALWLAMVLLGGLLALIGQTYQTGADTWELFSLWAALALPWAFAGRHAAIWLLWIAVANIALGLWAESIAHPWLSGDIHTLRPLGWFNAALFVVWTIAATRFAEFGGRVGPRLLVAAALFCLSLPAIDAAIGPGSPRFGYDVCIWLVSIAALIAFELRRSRDRAALALAAVAMIGVGTVWLYRLMSEYLFVGHSEPAALWLVLAVAVLGQATAAAWWLRRMDRPGSSA